MAFYFILNKSEPEPEWRVHQFLVKKEKKLIMPLDFAVLSFTGASFCVQILHSVSEDYSCLDTFRGTQNDLLYIFCHNPMGPDRQRRESWHAAVHTDVKFR